MIKLYLNNRSNNIFGEVWDTLQDVYPNEEITTSFVINLIISVFSDANSQGALLSLDEIPYKKLREQIGYEKGI